MKLFLPKALVAFACLEIVQGVPPPGLLKKPPSTGQDWVSLPDGTQFQPARLSKSDPPISALRAAQPRSLAYTDQFADGAETMYDEYSTAWRLLGWYIDCEASENQAEERRRLDDNDEDGEEEEEDEQENEDEGEEEEEEEEDQDVEEEDEDENQVQECGRYLLWAAYVDLDYEGGGTGEYQYYDRKNKKWNRSACKTHGNGRCARMDCHLASTHFKLLGFFKEYGAADFMEQLVKHEGYCTWDEDTYNFMNNYQEWWPEGCTQSNTYSEETGDYIYYDIKPLNRGRMGIGLYNDYLCSSEYTGKVTAEEVVMEAQNDGNNNGDENDNENEDENDNENNNGYGNFDLEEFLSAWNDALDDYKICQPCKTYDLSYDISANNNENGGEENEEEEGDGEDEEENDNENEEEDGDQDEEEDGNDRRRLENDYDPNEGYFLCEDAADAENVNMCMKFQSQTDMYKASFREVSLATQQRTIVRANADGVTPSRAREWWNEWGFFTISAIVFTLGALLLCWTSSRDGKRVASKSEPLLESKK